MQNQHNYAIIRGKEVSAIDVPVKLRLDKLLLDLNLAPSRERAQALILAGRVLVNAQKIEKPGTAVDPTSTVRLLGDDLRYVSRGGLKLEHALSHWHIDVAARTCLDVGTSTGGFTDCLLQHGTARVIAIDTGRGQIAAALRTDPRVRLLENTTARHLTAADLRSHVFLDKEGAEAASRITFLAMDVSFISATLVLPAVVQAIREVSAEASPSGKALDAVILVKPQFEAGREHVGKGGIVRDPAAHQAAIEKVRSAMSALGFIDLDVTDSPITGSEGNREFLLHGVLSEAGK